MKWENEELEKEMNTKKKKEKDQPEVVKEIFNEPEEDEWTLW